MAKFVIFEGETLADIAKRLGVSVRTVSRRKAKAKADGDLVVQAKPVNPPKKSKTTKRKKVEPVPVTTPQPETPAPKTKAKAKTKAKTKPVEPQRFVVTVTDTEAFIIDTKTNLNRTISNKDETYTRIREQCLNNDYNFEWLFKSLEQTKKGFTHNNIFIDLTGVYINGVKLDDELGELLVQMMLSDELDANNKFIKFLDKLSHNPKAEIQSELAGFLRFNDITINNDGDVVCYKRVAHDFKDLYSGTYDNSVGKTVRMTRKSVDDNRSNLCSHGLHVCSKSYLPFYKEDNASNKVIEVIVDPKDFVAIPTDYNNAKARVCKYFVSSVVDYKRQ